VRLSRPRVLLRLALLVVGGAFMWWQAYRAWGASGALDGGAAAFQRNVAVVAALVGTLALLTAAGAALSLKKRRREGSLKLGTPREAPREPPASR